MSRPACATCPYFLDQHTLNEMIKTHVERVLKEPYEPTDFYEIQKGGQCRRYPPPHYEDHADGHWCHEGYPEVEAWGFCGEHPSFPAYLLELAP